MGRGELKVKDANEEWFVWRTVYSTYGFHDTSSQSFRLLPPPIGQLKIFREFVCTLMIPQNTSRKGRCFTKPLVSRWVSE